MNNLKRLLTVVLSVVLILVFAVSCVGPGEPDSTEEPAATNAPVVEDGPESTTVVAMAGDQPIYSSEFYYFLYQAIREIYYKADGVYDPDADDSTNLAKMKEYFYSRDEEGVTYLKRAADRTLEISQGFKIAYKEGKALATQEGAKYTVDEEELASVISYIDSEADYGASMYGCSRDEYFFYAYGMNVNDAKRYTRQQVYAELHETYWADEKGYVVGMDEPQIPFEPAKPQEPAEDASEADKTKYEEDLQTYNTAKAKYDEELETYKTDYAKYEELLKAYYDKFREEYNENEDLYAYRTVRTLYLSKLDDSGSPLSEEAVEAKKKDVDTYISYVEGGQSFEKVVKGFSEDPTASSTMGLTDINVYTGATGDLPKEVIDRAFEINEISAKPELIETDTGLYLIMVEGIVTFDESFGLVADGSTANPGKVKNNVEYSKLAALYNEYVEELMKKDEYALKDINEEEALKLAKDYIEYTTEDVGIG